jgi:hypothetical protein
MLLECVNIVHEPSRSLEDQEEQWRKRVKKTEEHRTQRSKEEAADNL